MIQNTLLHAQKLTSQMTIQEKITQMLYQSPAIERLGIPAYNWWNEALHGVARAGIATMFPQAIGMAATFDENLLQQVADIVSTEGRAKFNTFSKKGDRGIYKGITFWAPNINIFRDPRWGRGHETFGEDPYLTSRLGIAYIKGLQGDDSTHLKTTACAKHFAVHSGPEGVRHSFDAVVNKKDLYDTYLYAFKRCVQEGEVEAIMGAYNRVNGEPACGSKTLLQDILRDNWNFKGHVVSDCWAIQDFHEHHHVTSTVVESAAMAVNNGCDLNCGNAFLHLYAAYEQGLVTEEAIDQAVIRLLDTRIRLGMLEDYPSPYEDISYELVECKEHIKLSLDVAKRSIVLLKNDGLLPLKKENLKSIAVIGPNANSRDGLIGNYVGTSSEYITPLEGIKNYVGDDVRVYYAQGTHLYKEKVECLAEDKDRFAEAILAAEMSDVVIMCLGLDATIEGEQGDAGNEYASGDKFDLNLPGNQQELLEAIHAVGKPVILLLSCGSALAIKWADENVNAILQTWYIGARGGKAIAELLFGEFSPSGKLPITFYNSTDELPGFEDYTMTNRTYRYMNTPALYPFGYGLTYTNIGYSNSHLSKTILSTNEDLTVTTTVTNSGKYAVQESIQIYIKDLESTTSIPHYALKGVGIVDLSPGESKDFSYIIKPRDLALINDEGECWLEPGKFTLYIGGGQPDIRTQALTGRTIDALDFEVIGTACQLEY